MVSSNLLPAAWKPPNKLPGFQELYNNRKELQILQDRLRSAALAPSNHTVSAHARARKECSDKLRRVSQFGLCCNEKNVALEFPSILPLEMQERSRSVFLTNNIQ